MTPPDHVGDDGTPRAGDGAPALSVSLLRGVLDGTYARQRSGLTNYRRLLPIGPRSAGVVLNSKTVTSHSSRIWVKPPTALQSVTLVYDNPGTSDIVVRASVEYPVGTFTPVYFEGGIGRDATIKPGGVVYARAVGLSFPGPTSATSLFYVRTYVTLASGTLACRNAADYNTGQMIPGVGVFDSWEDSVGTDKTASGTIGPGGNGYLYGPALVLGTASGYTGAIVGGLGDSILNGQTDAPLDGGYFSRAMIGVYPFVKFGHPGQGAPAFFPQNSLDSRLTMFEGCTHALVQIGTNDLINTSTLSTVQADHLTLWNLLASRGIKVSAVTLPPRTTSTDSWATTTNQTPNGTSFTTGSSSVRAQYNAWVRTIPAPLTGYVEIADAVESARDSGLWRPSYTNDGTHVTGAGMTAATAALSSAFAGLQGT